MQKNSLITLLPRDQLRSMLRNMLTTKYTLVEHAYHQTNAGRTLCPLNQC